jgi:hypothetical protein
MRTGSPPLQPRRGTCRAASRSVLALVLAAAVGVSAGPTATARAQAPESQWREAIDARWGPGLPTERKLEIFDTFWTTIDERFAAFQGLDVDWAALRDRYRPEIAAGVSRGRFAGIMGHLSLALRDAHTIARDVGVGPTPPSPDPKPGDPLFVLRGRFFNNFGACATAQDDGSALIYAVAPGHPLGLQPGDRILGYEGRPWRELYQELLAAELPIRASEFGSSPRAFAHTLVQSAPVNWHLFDTIDILKHDGGTIEHHPTAALNTTPALRSPFCTEGLAVPGVPRPPGPPGASAPQVSWGTIDGTRIGYIYVTAWQGTAGTLLEQAVRELTQDTQSDGLILDIRCCIGGDMWLSDAALGMLFDRPVPTIAFAERADPTDHFKMRPYVGEDAEVCGIPWTGFPPTLYIIDMCDRSPDPRSYDRPIAVLTGPNTVSAGDQVALRMTYHPRARVFGKTTNTAFTSPLGLELDPSWSASYALADAYRIDNPHDYLTHDEFPVDEPMWLTPDDVAEGNDTVVDAALRWISSQTH